MKKKYLHNISFTFEIKVLIAFLLLFSNTNLIVAQGTETFTNVPTASGTSYNTRNWTGDDGSTWQATNSRTSGATFTASGQGIALNDDNSDTYVKSGIISGGLGNITLTAKQIFSGSDSGNVTIYINDINVGTVPYDNSETGITTSINDINVVGNFVIRISNDVGGASGGGDDRVALDNITWTSYTSSVPTVTFDSPTSSETETDATFNTSIPVTLSNYNADVTVTAALNGSSTAEAGDYTIDLTPLVFDANETLNIPLDINDDADFDDETIVIDITVTSGTADLGTSTHTVTITDDDTPPAPSLIISEVTDPGDVANGRFVEIYNNGTTDINLTTEQIFIAIQSNGGNISKRALSGTLEANTVMIIGNSSNINTNYGFNADEDYGSITGNGDDGYFLYFGGDNTSGYLLDAYGVIGEDGTGKAWEYENSRAFRLNPTTVSPNATWTSGEWTIESGDLIDMTPGALENEFRFDGDWKPRDISDATSSDNVYITSDVIITSSLSVNNFEVTSGNTATLDELSTLIVNGTSSGNVTYNRNLGTENWYLVSSPVAGETYDDAYVTANSLAINGTNNAIGSYVPADDSWSYMQTGDAAANFNAGQGYSVRRETGQGEGDISFTGTINTESVETSSLAAGFNLLGNPYTSFVNSATFLGATTSSNLDQSQIWLWNQASGTYEVKTFGEAWILAPGQGFFVNATSTGTVTFDESNQAATGNAFQKNEKIEVKLLLSDGENNRFTKLNFGENYNKGYDYGWEGEVFGGIQNEIDVFTHLVEESQGKKYQVQSLPLSDLQSSIIPVGVTVEAGKTATFSIENTNVPSNINVYIEDKQDNSFTLLEEDANFSFTPENNLDGIGRFYIHTTTSSLSADDFGFNNTLSIYTSSRENLRVVGVQNGTANIQLYNILGKEVLKSSFEGNGVNDIALPKLNSGVYIVKIATETGTTNKKIIIQ
jgi:hypothetical protein